MMIDDDDDSVGPQSLADRIGGSPDVPLKSRFSHFYIFELVLIRGRHLNQLYHQQTYTVLVMSTGITG